MVNEWPARRREGFLCVLGSQVRVKPHTSIPVLCASQEKQDNITVQACQEEVFYFELMEVKDFRNDVILAEACRTDVEAFCKDVEPGTFPAAMTALKY